MFFVTNRSEFAVIQAGDPAILPRKSALNPHEVTSTRFGCCALKRNAHVRSDVPRADGCSRWAASPFFIAPGDRCAGVAHERTLPGIVSSAIGRHDLHSLVADVTVSYGIEMGGEWSLKPKVGLIYARTTRDDVTETGGSIFALGVARDRHVAGFIDGGLTVSRSTTSDAAFRPSITLGVRGQIGGKRVNAIGSYAGGHFEVAPLNDLTGPRS